MFVYVLGGVSLLVVFLFNEYDDDDDDELKTAFIQSGHLRLIMNVNRIRSIIFTYSII